VIALYEQVLEGSDPPPELEAEYIRLLISLSRIDQARARFDDGHVERAAGALGRPALVRVLEGYLLIATGEPQAAQEIFRERLQQEPSDAEALEGWVVLYEEYPGCVDPLELAGVLRKGAPDIEDPILLATFGEVYGRLMEQIRQSTPRK
jgi:hypothetical protein